MVGVYLASTKPVEITQWKEAVQTQGVFLQMAYVDQALAVSLNMGFSASTTIAFGDGPNNIQFNAEMLDVWHHLFGVYEAPHEGAESSLGS